ncbi:major capsid protein [Streptomyces sp. sk2.1]|uniref:major capsid protein n=1 Tax=Streptomyces sp. sk2.1 TaxID=2478959 RepID=UPI0011E87FD6|nr:major capsid protein [Streptomyces sp. sk2.1]TXS68946.1 major capsid protein E [Streptomyces sp. sk2.1]
MLETLLRDIDATEINAFARAVQTPADYALTLSVMPEKTINSVKFRIKSTSRRVNAAKYRAWDAQTAVATREAKRIVTEGMLPPLGQKYLVGELEQILLDTSRGADASELVELLYQDVAAHVQSIKSRLELAVGDLLTDGKFTLSGENGLTVEYDAGVPSANMPTAATAWTDPTADALKDEMAWIETLRASGAPLPSRVVTSYKARALLAANNAYRAAFYGSVSPSTTPTAVLAPNEVDVVRARYGLPPISVYDVQIPLDDGTMKRPLPEDRWLMLPPNPQTWGETQYGVTAESLVLSSGGNPAIEREEAPGIVVTHGYKDDPVQVWTKGAAVAMPVLYVPDIHITAKVF